VIRHRAWGYCTERGALDEARSPRPNEDVHPFLLPGGRACPPPNVVLQKPPRDLDGLPARLDAPRHTWRADRYSLDGQSPCDSHATLRFHHCRAWSEGLFHRGVRASASIRGPARGGADAGGRVWARTLELGRRCRAPRDLAGASGSRAPQPSSRFAPTVHLEATDNLPDTMRSAGCCPALTRGPESLLPSRSRRPTIAPWTGA
jgi:hypothetical protein